MTKEWTPQDLEYLTKWYPIKGAKECAKDLNRTQKATSVKASRLGLKVLSPNLNKWTEDELEILNKYYPTLGGVGCASLLPNRSYKVVVNKASTLGIKCKPLELTHEEYENRLMEIESPAFPVEKYINTRTAITHECIEGHTWKAKPHQILTNRTGCPICADFTFSLDKPSILYYIIFSDGISDYYKIGVTNRTVKQRFHRDLKYIKAVLLEEYFKTGKEAKDKEQSILVKFSKYRSFCDFISSGNTEVFEFDILGLDAQK